MIQPLRTVHRRAIVALGLVLPAILLAGLGARRRQPPADKNDANVPTSAQLLRKSDTLWQKQAIQTMFYGDPGDPQTVYVVLRVADALKEPDPLLYWDGGQPGAGTLSSSAHFLGSFAPGKVFTIHLDAERAGQLVLYSSAHRAVVDVATVEKLP